MDWTHLWHNALHWVTLHPVVAYLAVFLIALSESLALVGLLVPGTVIMIGIGAVVGSGVLSLKTTLLAAMLGAVAGDGISYWLGRRYHQGLKTLWPFRRYPLIFSRGEEFFHKHGGKSIFIGRFVGPVRPIIPVIAGMMDMPASRFLLVNVLSAVGWACAYLIPGVLLGGSLTLIGSVSARLSLLLLLVGLLLWLTFWLCRRAFALLSRLGPSGERLLLPVLSLVLVSAGWLFLGVLEDLLTLDPLVRADQEIFHFLQSLRTPWGDRILVAVTEMGDSQVILLVMATVLVALCLQRRLRAAGYWLVAVGGGAGMVQMIKWLMHRPRPIEIYQGVSSWSFPSSHTSMSVVLYGFLAILLVRGFDHRWRWFPFAIAIVISLLIAFSRLYLGAHWLSDILGGLSLGWAWVTFLGIFYLRRATVQVSRPLLLISLGLALSVAGAWHVSSRHTYDLSRYRTSLPLQSLSAKDWVRKDWRSLPGWRIDLGGEFEQPLTVQWVGNPERLASLLTKQGWRSFTGNEFKLLLNLFLPGVGVERLPLLPQFENGREERLLMALNRGQQRLVLRLWSTEFRLAETGQPLWVGTVESERTLSLADLMTIPKGDGDYDEALQSFKSAILPTIQGITVRRSDADLKGARAWDGRTLLAGEPFPDSQR